MSANAWFIIATVGFSLSGIALAAAVILFFKLDIPSVIGDLTGRTVAREIKAMRETNASSGDKRFRPSAVNLERGTLTEKVADSTTNGMAIAHASKRLDKASGEIGSRAFRRKKTGTIELSDAVQGKTDSGPTDVLESNAATEVLRTDGQKGPGENRAEVLRENTTEVLSDSVAQAQPGGPTEPLDTATGESLGQPTEMLEETDAQTPCSGPTEILSANRTAVLSQETEVLSPGTTVLHPTEKLENAAPQPVSFKIKQKEVVTHSDEVIE